MPLDLLAYLGGTIATLSYLPQIIKSSRTKSVGDISVAMLVMILVGISFWIIYGLLKPDVPIVVTNGVFSLLIGYQLYLKLKYDRPATITEQKAIDIN